MHLKRVAYLFKPIYTKVFFLISQSLTAGLSTKIIIQGFYQMMPNDAKLRHVSWTTLVQAMPCHMLGAKPLPEPVLTNCHVGHHERTLVQFESQYTNFKSGKCVWNCCLLNTAYFVQTAMRQSVQWIKDSTTKSQYKVRLH